MLELERILATGLKPERQNVLLSVPANERGESYGDYYEEKACCASRLDAR